MRYSDVSIIPPPHKQETSNFRGIVHIQYIISVKLSLKWALDKSSPIKLTFLCNGNFRFCLTKTLNLDFFALWSKMVEIQKRSLYLLYNSTRNPPKKCKSAKYVIIMLFRAGEYHRSFEFLQLFSHIMQKWAVAQKKLF